MRGSKGPVRGGAAVRDRPTTGETSMLVGACTAFRSQLTTGSSVRSTSTPPASSVWTIPFVRNAVTAAEAPPALPPILLRLRTRRAPCARATPNRRSRESTPGALSTSGSGASGRRSSRRQRRGGRDEPGSQPSRDPPTRNMYDSVSEAAALNRQWFGALPSLELEPITGIDREHLRRRLPERRHVFLRRALEDRRRSVVHRDDELRLEPLPRGVGRVLRVHDEVAADGHQDEVGLVVVGDQLHVAEDPRVAHVVELEPVLHLDDEAGRLAGRECRRFLRRRIGHG